MKTKPAAIIETVKEHVRAAFDDSIKLGTPVTDVVRTVARDVMRRAVDDGTDLRHTANGFMLGVLYGTKEAGKDILETIRHTAYVAMVEAGEVGGSLEAAALGLLAGAIHGAKEFKIEVQGATSAATDGVLKAADKAKSTNIPSVEKPSIQPGDRIDETDPKPRLISSKK